MAPRKKGSRLITVGGTAYRRRLRGRPAYDQGIAAWPMTYAVDHAQAPGTTLVVTTGRPHTANWFGRPAAPVLPGDVAASVRAALTLGWIPTAPGRPFVLDLPAGFDRGFQPARTCSDSAPTGR